MTVAPFGDFATSGYLRNIANEKNLAIVGNAGDHTPATAEFRANA